MATSGGARLSVNFRPGPLVSLIPALRALRRIDQTPMARATMASPSQTARHRGVAAELPAAIVAAVAVAPIIRPPHPGTAVKEPARSMVSRIKRRLSIARACKAGGPGGRGGPGGPGAWPETSCDNGEARFIPSIILPFVISDKYFVRQSQP